MRHGSPKRAPLKITEVPEWCGERDKGVLAAIGHRGYRRYCRVIVEHAHRFVVGDKYLVSRGYLLA
jgi:hypothetical protein